MIKLSSPYEEKDERVIMSHRRPDSVIQSGAKVVAGQQLTEGQLKSSGHPEHISGKEAVQRYLCDEVRRFYRSQGVTINDKTY